MNNQSISPPALRPWYLHMLNRKEDEVKSEVYRTQPEAFQAMEGHIQAGESIKLTQEKHAPLSYFQALEATKFRRVNLK